MPLTDSHLSPWRFSSKCTDPTDLVYFGRRYYIPTQGRWLTPDPAGFQDGPNLYAYTCNRPLTHTDLYTNNLKNWEFGKAGARSLIQRSDAEAAQLQQVGRYRRNQNLGCPAQPKTNS